jgi:hypothetical protein
MYSFSIHGSHLMKKGCGGRLGEDGEEGSRSGDSLATGARPAFDVEVAEDAEF